jgi:hypothetical protein
MLPVCLTHQYHHMRAVAGFCNWLTLSDSCAAFTCPGEFQNWRWCYELNKPVDGVCPPGAPTAYLSLHAHALADLHTVAFATRLCL